MITIKIDNLQPTPLNKLLGNWRAAMGLKKKDRNIIAWHCLNLPKASQKRRVTLTIILGKGQRGCDPDAYFKSMLDALVHAGMLVDDSYKWIELAPVKFIRGDKGCIIELEDCN